MLLETPPTLLWTFSTHLNTFENQNCFYLYLNTDVERSPICMRKSQLNRMGSYRRLLWLVVSPLSSNRVPCTKPSGQTRPRPMPPEFCVPYRMCDPLLTHLQNIKYFLWIDLWIHLRCSEGVTGEPRYGEGLRYVKVIQLSIINHG